MKKFLERWQALSVLERLLLILSLVLCLTVIVLAVLSLLGIWDAALTVCMPLMAAIMGIQAWQQFRLKNRGTTIVSICSAAVIVLCFIIVIIAP